MCKLLYMWHSHTDLRYASSSCLFSSVCYILTKPRHSYMTHVADLRIVKQLISSGDFVKNLVIPNFTCFTGTQKYKC